MPLVICIVSRGRSRGKTSLIEGLTEKFVGEGFRVATVKHIYGLFDTAKKDTWRHLEAGAAITVASTPNEIVTISRTADPTLEKALDAIYIEPDLILVEGYKKSSVPKILCTDTAVDAAAALKEISNVIIVSGYIATRSREKERFQTEFPGTPVYSFEKLVSALKERLARSILKRLPGLNCGHCGYDTCLDFSKAVLKGEATMEDCEVLATNIATLSIDGKNVPMMKFVQQIVRGVTLGIVETLKGVKKHPKNVEISIKID